MHVHGLVIRCDSYTDTHSPDVNRMGQPGSHESVRLLPALEVLFAQLVRPVQQRLLCRITGDTEASSNDLPAVRTLPHSWLRH